MPTTPHAGASGIDPRRMAIYLNDHLAGATVGVELARRASASNRGSELGRFLARLVREVEEDRSALERVMEQLGLPQDRLKVLVGWAGEKVGRLKPNGQLTGYSPLSRVVELEGLSLGVEGKLAAWRSLERAVGGDARLEGIDFGALVARATEQRRELERHRLDATDLALTP